MKKNPIPLILLLIAYIMLSLFGLLSGMFSETLIGSTHPWADVLADAIMWFSAVVAFSPMACVIAAGALREKPAARRIVLAVPFILLTIQLGLSHVVNML